MERPEALDTYECSPGGGSDKLWRNLIERDVLNGILWVLRTGCPLARHARALTALTDLPSAFPTVTEDGIFSRILETLPEDLVESLDHSLS